MIAIKNVEYNPLLIWPGQSWELTLCDITDGRCRWVAAASKLEFEAGRVQFELQSQFEFQSQLGTRCRSESQRQTEGLGLQDPGWAAQQNEEKVLL